MIRFGRTDSQVSENGRPEEGQSAHVADERQTTKGRIPDGERAGIVYLKFRNKCQRRMSNLAATTCRRTVKVRAAAPDASTRIDRELILITENCVCEG